METSFNWNYLKGIYALITQVNVCVWGLNPACQYGQEPLALARLRLQCSQNTGSRTLRALSGSTLPRWRGAHGATGTAPSQWLLLRNHRKSFVMAGPVLARSTDTMPASIYLYATETDEFASVSSDTLGTHTHAHAHRLFVLIIHKQSLNLNSPLTSAILALLWSVMSSRWYKAYTSIHTPPFTYLIRNYYRHTRWKIMVCFQPLQAKLTKPLFSCLIIGRQIVFLSDFCSNCPTT